MHIAGCNPQPHSCHWCILIWHFSQRTSLFWRRITSRYLTLIGLACIVLFIILEETLLPMTQLAESTPVPSPIRLLLFMVAVPIFMRSKEAAPFHASRLSMIRFYT